MGMMSFLIPRGLAPSALRELERICIAGGYDHTPVPTQVQLRDDRLDVSREPDESGYVLVPWEVLGVGRLMNHSATLMERSDPPYYLPLELARGKLNQLRNQVADWRMIGLQVPPEDEDFLRRTIRAFTQVVLNPTDEQFPQLANEALKMAFQSADRIVALYVDQLIAARKHQTPLLNTHWACQLAEVPPEPLQGVFLDTFNTAALPLSWRDVEPYQSGYQFDALEQLLSWAQDAGVYLTTSPLIDFSATGLPSWVLEAGEDPNNLASYMCDYVETIVARYRDRIRRWHLCTASNNASIPGLSEDDVIRLTARLAESAWQIDPELEVVLGIAQPWGDYMAQEDRTYSPFVFADTLLRAGLPIAAFDLEWHMGTSPRGSYCRDALDASQLLDMFALLGTPLQLTLSYPSSDDIDIQADPMQVVSNAGHWREGVNRQAQASWAETFARVAVCKPYVASVTWCHFRDQEGHLMPNAGLIDADEQPKPALERLRAIRRAHLQ